MRRGSYTPLSAQTSLGEPLIVVEESGGTDDEESPNQSSPPTQLNINPDSPLLNPELLSPYRDMRKRSLPTPSCTSGITASQVRRLSEHGIEASSSQRGTEFLATLSSSSSSGTAHGGRRHSVVTISRVAPPNMMFERGRRESFAAFPTKTQGRILPYRRESLSGLSHPPSTSTIGGSSFNLALDIMDNIAEIKAAKKVRLKMCYTQASNEQQPSDAQQEDSTSGAVALPLSSRYYQQNVAVSSINEATTPISRRYSDLVSSTAQPVQYPRRRASEQPNSSSSTINSTVVTLPSTSKPSYTSAGLSTSNLSSASAPNPASGIVCSNNDLISILNSLASSAQEINQTPKEPVEVLESASASNEPSTLPNKKPLSSVSAEHKRNNLKNLRSNSFDISILLGTSSKPQTQNHRASIIGPASWFVKRHQPKRQSIPTTTTGKQKQVMKSSVVVTYNDQKPNVSIASAEAPASEPKESASLKMKTAEDKTALPPTYENKVVWDEQSVVDARVLGTAIEDFLARRGNANETASSVQGSVKISPPKTSSATENNNKPPGSQGGSSWFTPSKQEDDDASASDTCDSSLCSTLKDLFVK